MYDRECNASAMIGMIFRIEFKASCRRAVVVITRELSVL